MVRLRGEAKDYDAIIVGGGHNGLVCAAYLARARMKILVLESRDEIGGGAVTTDLGDGFKVSGCAHVMTGFDPGMARDLGLARHGLKLMDRSIGTIGLARDGRHLYLGREMGRMKAALLAHSLRDAVAFEMLWKSFGHLADVVRALVEAPPPIPDEPYENAHATLSVFDRRLNRLKAEERRLFNEILPLSITDLVERSFETAPIKGLLAAMACLGHGADPRAPGTAPLLLLRLAFEQSGGRGLVELPRGGLGALSQALGGAAQKLGAEIRVDAPVARIDVEDGHAVGVVLESGEKLRAPIIISNVDPKTTFLSFLPAGTLDTNFRRRVGRWRARGVSVKINMALRGLPGFTGLTSEDMASRLIVAPSLEYVHRAYSDLVQGRASPEPIMEIMIPTIRDPSLAPNGRHVLSVIAQYAPYDIAQGNLSARDTFAARVGEVLVQYAPNLGDLIEDYEVLGPRDIEERFGMAGGDWHQGEMALDQLLWLRPAPGAANYRTPIDGLYLCGAGTHPGGGIAGVSGRLAANAILKTGRKS